LPLEFRVLGSTDRDAAFGRLGNVGVTGPYREQDVYQKLATLGCHLAFLPSLWPETYMYTLSIAMAAGLYVIAFDVGAQAERLRAWGWGRVLPLDAAPETINTAILDAARWLASGSAVPPTPPRPASYPKLLASYYGFTAEEQDAFPRAPTIARGKRHGRATEAVPCPHFQRGGAHARLH
jgi:hypothetical protein